MRFLWKVSIPVEAGNAAAKNGFEVMRKILDQQRPEATYFYADGGKRTGILIIDMQDLSEIPAIAEPWFHAFNADVEVFPVMVPADLQKAGPAIADAVKVYG